MSLVAAKPTAILIGFYQEEDQYLLLCITLIHAQKLSSWPDDGRKKKFSQKTLWKYSAVGL